jgi:hypothetical protein
VTDSALVLPSIARALGVQEGGAQSLRESLVASLVGLRLLVVLDNLEQVIDAAPGAGAAGGAGLIAQGHGPHTPPKLGEVQQLPGEQQTPSQQVCWRPSPHRTRLSTGDQSDVLADGKQNSHGFAGLTKPSGKNWPPMVQPSAHRELPPISQTPSALQHARGSQQTPLQQNWAPMGPHGTSSNWTVQDVLLTNGLQISHPFAGLSAPSGNVAPSIVQVSPPHAPQFASSEQQTPPGQHAAKQHSRPQQRPSWCSHLVGSDGADQSVVLTAGSQTSQSLFGLTSPGAKFWPSIRQPHDPHAPCVQHSPFGQQLPAQQT